MKKKAKARSKRQRRPVSKKLKLDPLRNNPVVGFISEAQAERLLRELRGSSD